MPKIVEQHQPYDPLAVEIAKHITYDGAPVQDEEKCPKCGHILQDHIDRYWIDHKSSLAGVICKFLGFKQEGEMYRLIYGIVEEAEYNVGGPSKSSADAKMIAKWIWEGIYD